MATRKEIVRGNPVTDILDDWIRNNGEFSQIEMAERIGVTKSANCFISQVRSGRSKMPITKVVPLAKLLGEDPAPMVAAALDLYYPELRDALIECNILKQTESGSLKDLRQVANEKKQAV
jgi:transcriptional regulator with XRE-family HTH domain